VAEVVWTRRALPKLERIRAYVGEFSPLASQRLALRLYNSDLALAETPLRG
jgi:plasmid stabilization system protein ParE